MDVRRNVEIKARIADRGAVRRLIQQVATERVGQQKQTDTYFHCRVGRLKLREIVGHPAQLIWYDRPDADEPKESRYYLIEISDPEALRAALTAGLGVRTVVRKRREIYLYRFVRIHLDQVDGLGEFLELEGVLGPDVDLLEAERVVADLMERLDIARESLVEGSYGEMLNGAV